jgi:hypothetical protein
MKKFLFVFLIMTFVSVTYGQKAEKSVADAVDKLKEAMISGNRTDLENIALDQLTYGHSSGLIENKAEFVDHIASGRSDFISIDLKDQTVVVSGKTAIVRHILMAKTNDGGKPGEVNLKILLVWQKVKNTWKLLARQAVKNAP